MKKRHKSVDNSQNQLSLSMPSMPPCLPEMEVKELRRPIWSEHKARLVQSYLLFFSYVTKHGVYIDGFAGPQNPHRPESWTAKLVLEEGPERIRAFHLFEFDHKKIESLKELQRKQMIEKPDRRVKIYEGDFNERIRDLLNTRLIKNSQATFCLLDQRTFECNWSTVKALAEYKHSGYKIELFYFLANSWLDRAFAGQKDETVLEKWWGGADWLKFKNERRHDRPRVLAHRLRTEFGYKWAHPYPIYEREGGGTIMYYMIHASDHDEAPVLMTRAYNKVVEPPESSEQLPLDFP